MTYQEVLDWMFVQLPMYQQKGKLAHSGKLDAIIELSSFLGNPHKKFKSIHVAGTNGKGSSSHMLASILQEAGYKVGLYTSPHLKDFRERIKINGNCISEKEVVNFIEGHLPYLKANELSFFEMTVGMAFDYFANQNVNIAIVEVGLGGRLDSTNIITPEVSLITNISFDHVDMLGDTLEKIASEKAGIIKSNVPVVISETQKETEPVFSVIAERKNALITFADTVVEDDYKTSLLGIYQSKNIKGVLGVIKQLNSFKIKKKHIKAGLLKVVENTGLLGRWQVLSKRPTIICDTAHNTEGIKLIVEQLKKQEFDQLHMVLGFVKDKNLDAVLALLPKNAIYYYCSPSIERGLDVHLLKSKSMAYGFNGVCYDSVNEAFNSAKKMSNSNDFIYVGGSTFVVAEIL
ncbi:bifunctional folylpolyglutamate synthase/dihydrofolate synthase [Cellulophaga baltica]|uniref:bifunctional folylpolyglutamate synthase/dihydrofolate synthase n=1 Tax=Cellulophaga TaxID=104264 RepID=UPI001C06E793|nr:MULTISPECIES: folylpolyglutamate synthase/dihydrofolate synthase family protein [Cellulophaga]MBU2997180.1 bifunctional folylpolyglutamate synthase/dihydrofolate synthase [Cellulophaga baltica]MDO6768578.1 folylpolyglutamate synthase/dihydrofolate synthase family protein [Cellulophaga sp. 1_MG-2023]